MIKPEKPSDEAERMDALEAYNVLDTIPEKDFDDITLIAAQICDTPIALVSLIDHERQWFKSRVGLDAEETPRELAFCAHAILNPEEVLVVPDSQQDERFVDNPLAVGAPHVKFYAGAPLVTPNGFPLGTLCVIDDKPRALTETQINSLTALSSQVVAQLELRKKVRDLEFYQQELESSVEDLKRFAYVASHDLKTPLRGMSSIIDWLISDHKSQLDEQGQEYLGLLHGRSEMMQKLIDGILEYSRVVSGDRSTHKDVQLSSLISQACKLTDAATDALVTSSDIEGVTIHTNGPALLQILQNLLSNAIQHNDKDKAEVNISYDKNFDSHLIRVSDNGPGIAEQYHDKIFEMFETLGHEKNDGQSGTGIGLASVKKLATKLGGRIEIFSDPGKGAVFTVHLPL